MPQTGLLIFLFVSLLLMRPLIALAYASGQVITALVLAPGNSIRAFLGSYGEARGSLHLGGRRLQVWIHPRLFLLPFSHVDFSAGPRVPRGRQILILMAGPITLLVVAGLALALLFTGNNWGAMRFASALLVALTAIHLLRALLAKIETFTWEDYGLVMGDGQRLGILLQHGRQAPEVQRVIWHWVRDDYRSVLQELKPLLEENKIKPELYEYAIYACLAEGEIQTAMDLHAEMTRDRLAEPMELVMLSYLQLRSGDADLAMETVELALRRTPGFHLALNQRAWLRLERGDAREALPDLDRALRSDPEFATAWSNRALAHLRLNELEKAAKDLEKALKLDPLNATAHTVSADLNRMNGREEAAATADATVRLLRSNRSSP